MNKLPLILIAIGLIFVVIGLLIDWQKSRKEVVIYMNYGGFEPRSVTIKSSRPISEFPQVLLNVPGIKQEKVWFTDKRGKLLDSTEETDSAATNRIWWVSLKPSPVPKPCFHLPLNPKPKS